MQPLEKNQHLGNPQGKGLVPVLEQWASMRPVTPSEKSPHTLLSDYFISLLILSAEFAFKPVIEQHYYLYHGKSASPSRSKISDTSRRVWKLSLIAPEQCGRHNIGTYVGYCQLRTDMTWALSPDTKVKDNVVVIQALKHFQQQFSEHLDVEQPLSKNLPYYADELPFYRRLAATGLARSINASLTQCGLLERPSAHWKTESTTSLLGISNSVGDSGIVKQK